ncbi:HNH endonuclease [Gordonia sp. LSe1-13]|uniref:HNH endonuclease n=1 Tax=Gordonia sesuvii TaxID=3116777 RepID=A0ABU7MFJ3_9ACTN|nr:HNH endonuclease [Gordonia sp. LSe1-13]
MDQAHSDPLALGQKLVALLEGGRRTATYKLAVLMALLDLSVESVPDDPNTAVDIDLDDLTTRVIELYWRQMRPLDGHQLRQSTDGRGVIFATVAGLRAELTSAHRAPTIDLVVADRSDAYHAAHTTVKRTLVRYPLKLLQNVTTATAHERFLYDDSWMGTDSLRVVADHGNKLILFPGVCTTLARLAPLLKPAFQLAWVDDVRRMNKTLLADGPDIADHLFGTDRVSLLKAGDVLASEFGPHCFYCSARLTATRHVDHVLPWSRVGIDGLANLVLACPSCNSNKSDLLPSPTHVDRALGRGQHLLDELAAGINWPSQFDRVVSAAHGLYATQPESTPVWLGRKDIGVLGKVDFDWTSS